MRAHRLLLLLVLAAACDAGGDPGGAADTDTDAGTDGMASGSGTSGGSGNASGSPWGSTADTTPWNIDTEDPPATTAPVTTGVATQGGETEGDGETEGFEETEGKVEEDFIGWFGYGIVEPGVSYEPQGEVIVFTGGVDHCILVWNATSTPTDACTECEGAFSLTIGDVEAEAEEDCSLVGTDSKMLPGTTLGVGWSGEELYVDFGDGFALSEGGFAEYVPERQEFFWELPLGE